MRYLLTSLFALSIAVAGYLGGRADDTAEPNEQPAKQDKRRRIIAPPGRAKFQLRVQERARFPKEERPQSSQPASSNGLSVTVQAEKKEFAGNGPLAFEVVLKNVSQKPLTLAAADVLGGRPKLVIANQKTAAQWTLAAKLKPGHNAEPITLKPGESLTRHVVVEANFIFPRPIPLPRPRPIPLPQGTPQPRKGNAKAGRSDGVRPRGRPRPVRPIGKPIRPPVFVGRTLPCGQGPCRARLFLEFRKAEQAGEAGEAMWTGKLASNTFAFRVAKPETWTPGQPLNKRQAIRLAHPVAERALSAAYKPVPGLRPPKHGPWIESPEKSAAAKKDKNGRWTISWTQFPKRGHSYNITLTVSPRGGVAVGAIFTGYSKQP